MNKVRKALRFISPVDYWGIAILYLFVLPDCTSVFQALYETFILLIIFMVYLTLRDYDKILRETREIKENDSKQ